MVRSVSPVLAGLALLAGALAGGDPATAAGDPPYAVVELGRRYARLQDAVDAIGDRMATIRIAPGVHRDCAIQRAGDIAFVAATDRPTSLVGRACEDKAALVLRGRSARVEGLTFAELTSRDGNGAGIRLEHGNLLVRRSWFRDSQQGLLTASDPAGRIVIESSTFTRLGTCAFPGGCAHSLYVGDYGELVILDSRFESGVGGHYVKCRAPRITVRDSSFDDADGSGTNYMIDLANGATGQITGNWFVQGRNKENHSAFIAVAAEGAKNSSAGLEIAGNHASFVPGLGRTSAFVADWSGDRLSLGDNVLTRGITAYDPR